MMRALLYWITSRLPCRIIADAGRPYLERYYVATFLGWQFYLHRFVASDPDRGLHDHPWPRAFSIILAGWYWEETRSGTRKVQWLNSLTGDTFHRVVLPVVPWQRAPMPVLVPERAVPCWTLFFHRAKRTKPWGFWRTFGTGAIFEPYLYPKEGDQTEWWTRAPKGRDEPRRLPR